MCGIWASIGFELTESAMQRVAHRGPDGSGWISLASAAGAVNIGHRLLSITSDVEDGKQPVSDATCRKWLTYNGEIYFRSTLVGALQNAGHAFEGHSDTALVLAALSAWGVEALERFEGMFALASFDASAGRLLVARDRFGIKPLYMLRSPGGVAFASEIKQFQALPSFRARLNVAGAQDFLELGLTDHGTGTLWRDVSIVPPGTAVIVDIEAGGGLRVSEHRWYHLPQVASTSSIDDFESALRASVDEHLPSRAPAGISLSGGLDSSAVACLARDPLPCFSLFHDEPEHDESRFASSVARHLKRTLVPVRLGADELQAAVEAVVHHLDEPFPSLSTVAQWAVFRAARAHGIKVMLTGQGADELLGGYPFMLGPLLASYLRRGRFDRACAEMVAQRRVHGRRLRSQLRMLAATYAPAGMLASLSRQGWSDPQLSRARLAVARGGGQDCAARGIGAFRRDLLGAANLSMLLRYEDRTAMAHGIEARPPFLDRRVVEASLAMDGADLVAAGVTKRPLRAVADRLLPADVRERLDKRGFPTPEHAWVKGPLAGYVSANAAAAHRRFPELVSAPMVEQVQSVLREPGPLRAPVWRTAALGAWAEEFGVEA